MSVLETTSTYEDGFINTTSESLQPLNIEFNDVPWYFALCIVVFGTVGNTLLCLCIIVDKRLQTNTNYFLFSMSVADLLISLLVIPARFALYEFPLVPSTFPWCLFYVIGDDFLTAASALHICFISIERYLIIKNPIMSSRMTKKRLLKRILLVWALSFLSIIPFLTSGLRANFPQKRQYCAVLLSYFPNFETILFTECFVIFVMVGVLVYCFVRTTLHLREMSQAQQRLSKAGMMRVVAGNRVNGNFQEADPEKKALKVVWIMSFAFIIALTPYGVCNLINYFAEGSVGSGVNKAVAYLNYMNSVINPIIYTIFNKHFRKNFVNLLLFKYKFHLNGSK